MTATAILRSPKQIADADTAMLLATYNALTGKAVKKFSSRAAGERQVEMAMLAAQDSDAHSGVPKDSVPKVITAAEFTAKTGEESPVAQAPEFTGEADPEYAALIFTPGSLADQLDKASRRSVPIVPREKKDAKEPSAPRATLTFVKATGAGTSKVQASSTRGEVFAVITAACGNPVSVAALDTQFSCNTKGYLQKLIEKNHIVPCSETGEVSSAAAAPAADVAE